jgi:hypothetical protein
VLLGLRFRADSGGVSGVHRVAGLPGAGDSSRRAIRLSRPVSRPSSALERSAGWGLPIALHQVGHEKVLLAAQLFKSHL